MWGHATAQRPEPVQAKVGVGAPEVIAGEVDVLPAERREVSEQRIWHRLATTMQGVQRAVEIDGVPQGDGSRDQGQAAGTVLLGLGRAVTKAAKPMEAHGTGERVTALAFVQLGRRLPSERGLFQPVQDVESALDAADLAQ